MGWAQPYHSILIHAQEQFKADPTRSARASVLAGAIQNIKVAAMASGCTVPKDLHAVSFPSLPCMGIELTYF